MLREMMHQGALEFPAHISNLSKSQYFKQLPNIKMQEEFMYCTQGFEVRDLHPSYFT